MKYLILGANGLIGQAFVRLCRERGIQFTGTRYSRGADDFVRFDQLQLERIPRFFGEVAPDVVINAIGLAGGVNFCQQNPEIGRKYHVDAVEAMVNWCKENNAGFAFISTDYVFDGANPPYKEEDKTHPLNLYGQLKLEAEQIIEDNLKKYVIARTTNVFGWDPETVTPNFLMHVMQTLKEQDSIKVPSFLYGTPTLVDDLAAGIMDLLDLERFGLYHIVGPGYINRYDWAVKCLEMAGITGKTIDKVETPPQGMAPRPLRSHLDNSKFCSTSKVKMHDVEQGLRIFADAMNA
jgi:dTDP-4-dehydrorhamnose reductase